MPCTRHVSGEEWLWPSVAGPGAAGSTAAAPNAPAKSPMPADNAIGVAALLLLARCAGAARARATTIGMGLPEQQACAFALLQLFALMRHAVQ